jgi:cytochrome b561
MQQNWNINTRLIHWALVITVIFQQFSSIWMSDQGTQFLFPYHRIIGALAAAVVLVFWLNSYAMYHFKELFSWGKQARDEVIRELLGLLKRQLPASGNRIGLSSFIHGLGILSLTGCAVTGMIMFSMIPPGHSGPPDDPMAFTRYTLQHKFFGVVLWVYVCGHVAFAVLPQLKSDNVMGAIFSLKKDSGRTK